MYKISINRAKLGLPDPMLTTEQLKSAAVKRTTLISSAVGLLLVLLGMLPLLFMDDDRGLKQIFNEIDIDKSGDISFEELQIAVRSVGLNVRR